MTLQYFKFEATAEGGAPAAVLVTAYRDDVASDLEQFSDYGMFYDEAARAAKDFFDDEEPDDVIDCFLRHADQGRPGDGPVNQVFWKDNLDDWRHEWIYYSDWERVPEDEWWERVFTAEDVLAMALDLDQRFHLTQCLEGYSFPANAKIVEGKEVWPGKLKYGLDLGDLRHETWPSLNLPMVGDEFIEPRLPSDINPRVFKNTIALFCTFVQDRAFIDAPIYRRTDITHYSSDGGHMGAFMVDRCAKMGLRGLEHLSDEALFYCLAWACALVRKVASSEVGASIGLKVEPDPVFTKYCLKASDFTNEPVPLDCQTGNPFQVWSWPVATAARLSGESAPFDKYGRSNSPWCGYEAEPTWADICKGKMEHAKELQDAGPDFCSDRNYYGPYVEPCHAHVRRMLIKNHIYTRCVDPDCMHTRDKYVDIVEQTAHPMMPAWTLEVDRTYRAIRARHAFEAEGERSNLIGAKYFREH